MFDDFKLQYYRSLNCTFSYLKWVVLNPSYVVFKSSCDSGFVDGQTRGRHRLDIKDPDSDDSFLYSFQPHPIHHPSLDDDDDDDVVFFGRVELKERS